MKGRNPDVLQADASAADGGRHEAAVELALTVVPLTVVLSAMAISPIVALVLGSLATNRRELPLWSIPFNP